jgi:hypothetical protein
MSTLLQDFRYAPPGLQESRHLAHAILSLALGIGATISVFSIIYAVLMNPWPYQAPIGLACLLPTRRASAVNPMTALRCD